MTSFRTVCPLASKPESSYNKSMKKTIAKGILLLIIFISALYLISDYLNQGNVDMTAPMGPATYPLMYIIMDGHELNMLHGYAEAMDTATMRETLTPLSEGRELTFRLDKFENTIESITFEVRNLEGSRLIERTEVNEYEESRDGITARINIKDLIDPELQYSLTFLVDTGMDRIIRFYTRIYSIGDTHSEEKIAFCFNFHEKTFNKEEGRELTQYLEPNALGDNTNFNKVTINSSFQQVTWGHLNVTRISEPVLYIKEIATETGSFVLKYDVYLDDAVDERYAVSEFYRLRRGTERIFLLDFERRMEQIFHGDEQNINDRHIYLGICDPQIPLSEADGGNVFAFEIQNGIYAMILPDEKFIRLFSFADEENSDERTQNDGHRAKILNVDEAGNVVFMVYGYMSRGRYEGRVGITVYYYNSMVNTIEEKVFIPYNKSPELLLAEIEQLSYLNRNMRLFLMINNEIHAIALEGPSSEILVTGIKEDSYHISDSNKMLVWQDAPDIYSATSLNLMNLQNEEQSIIKAGYNEYIMPLGFVQEDLVYGLAKAGDVSKDAHGNTVFPMYAIKIQSETGETVMDHRRDGFFITHLSVDGNQINLYRLEKDAEGNFIEAEPTQISNQAISGENRNRVEVFPTESYLRVVRIVYKQAINSAQVAYLMPRHILYEGTRELNLKESEPDISRYYVYGKGGVLGIYLSEARAVNAAFDNAATVIDDKGEYIWYRGNLSTRNQIMAIEAVPLPGYGNSMSVCLDVMLRHGGVTRSTYNALRRGQSVTDILMDALPDIKALDLGGCSLESVLYYVNRDIPVLVILDDEEAVLIVGFNDQQLVLMDPHADELVRISRADAAAWFEEADNHFVTYLRMLE